MGLPLPICTELPLRRFLGNRGDCALEVVIFRRILTVERIRNGRGREGGYHATPLFFFAVLRLPSRVGDHQPGPTLSGGGPAGGRALARGGSNPSPSARRISSVKATPLLFT